MPANPDLHLPEDWPNAGHSRFIETAGIRWHVQRVGAGPCLLLLHGTGASTHSFAPLVEHLKSRFECILPDLPGHGFSEALAPDTTTIPGVSGALLELLRALGKQPELVVGHSAGAAIGAAMALRQPHFRAVVSINGAFLPFGHVAAPLFSRSASWLARASTFQRVTALHGYFQRPVRKMLADTGSEPDDTMVHRYQQLLQRPAHIRGTLQMMAGWDLKRLMQELPDLRVPLHLIVCEQDRVVSTWQSEQLSGVLWRSSLYRLPDLGHLGHEENPRPFAQIIKQAADEREAAAPPEPA